MREIASRYTRTWQSLLTIAFYDFDLHELWYLFIRGARITAADDPAQESLVSQVLLTREICVLSRKVGEVGEASKSPEMEIATASDGKIWSGLPFLVEEIQKVREKSMNLPVVQYHNLSAFVAQLVSVGVRDLELSLIAIWILQDTLETPRPEGMEDDEGLG